jgi:hypothetical protein
VIAPTRPSSLATRPVAAADRWLLAPAPPERLAVLRVLVGGYAVVVLLVRPGALWSTGSLPPAQWAPVGPLWWLASPPSPGVARLLLVATLLAGVAFVAGWRWRLIGPLFAVLFLAATTYRVSWGQVLHVDHLPVLHVLVLGFVPAAAAWSVDARRRPAAPAPHPRFGWPVRVLAVLTVVTYVLAGWAKLRNGGVDWIAGDVLRNQVAYDNLRKVLLGDVHSPVGGYLVRFGWFFPPLAVLTLVVELGAPLALLGGRLRTWWAATAWVVHVGIVVLMAITFPYPIAGIAFAPLFRVERLGRAAGHAWQRRGRWRAAR